MQDIDFNFIFLSKGRKVLKHTSYENYVRVCLLQPVRWHLITCFVNARHLCVTCSLDYDNRHFLDIYYGLFIWDSRSERYLFYTNQLWKYKRGKLCLGMLFMLPKTPRLTYWNHTLRSSVCTLWIVSQQYLKYYWRKFDETFQKE